MHFYTLGVVTAMLLDGCASVVPQTIRSAAPGNVQIAQVREQPQQYRNSALRWGGNIVSIRNERDQTILEIVGRNLDDDGRPQDEDRSQGRFLANVPGFLDPAIYKPERAVTVFGRIEGVVDKLIGEFRYTYPVVQADTVYLWQPLPRRQYDYDPYYYDPFIYSPWYPRGWPYYRPWPYY